MQVAYVAQDLTNLRYFIPFSNKMHEFMPDIEQSFYIPRDSAKYNGLAWDDNYALCVDRLKRFCQYSYITDEAEHFDIAFQVELQSKLACDRRIAFQHGFDYIPRLKETQEQIDTYICNSKMMFDAAIAADLPAVLAPFPISMWSADEYCVKEISELPKKTKTALVFYPDEGDVGHVSDVVNTLETLGFVVYVKQRVKHQPIEQSIGGVHMYDASWYPSESIAIPLHVDIVIGFGSTAYVDIVPMGIPYLNIDLHSDEEPWCKFLHPVAKNYFRITSEDRILTTLASIALRSKRIIKPVIDVEQLRKFMLELI